MNRCCDFSFHLTTQNNILSILNSVKIKASGIDSIGVKQVKML